jgi:DNA invertase Pin-like site-specific DNA recombinase
MDDLCDTSDPSRVMMRQIAGAFAQYEKARLVARLRRARELKGKPGGRKPLAETRPEVVELARKLTAQDHAAVPAPLCPSDRSTQAEHTASPPQ